MEWSPGRTNRAERCPCLRRSLYARSTPIAPRPTQPRIPTDPLARSRQSLVGGRTFRLPDLRQAAFEDIAQPTAATTLAAAAIARVLFAPQQWGDTAPLSASPWADSAGAGTMKEHGKPVHCCPTRSPAPVPLGNRVHKRHYKNVEYFSDLQGNCLLISGNCMTKARQRSSKVHFSRFERRQGSMRAAGWNPGRLAQSRRLISGPWSSSFRVSPPAELQSPCSVSSQHGLSS
jgi:hypothetical protein